MEIKLILPILIIGLIFVSGCTETKDLSTDETKEPEKVVEEMTKESEEIIGDDCGTVAPAGRIECCQRKGYDGWDGEKCIYMKEKITSVSLISQDYSNKILELYIRNTANSDLSLGSEDIFVVIEDNNENDVCSGNLASGVIRCYSGCGGHVDAGNAQRLKIDFSNCEALASGKIYYYSIEFEGDASVSGSFTETEGTGSPTGNFVLFISDKEADIGDFESLVVSFSKTRIFQSGESGGFEEFELSGTSVDLTQVVGEKAISVLNISLEEGSYTKIELYVSEVEGILNGTNGTVADVEVPSDKLQIVREFEIKANETTKFVFDINIVKKGHRNEYNLLPVIAKSGTVGEDIDEPEEEECTVDEDCEGDKICVNGECEEPECINDTDCAELEICEAGECEEVECKVDEDCETNQICLEYNCVDSQEPECVNDTDCLENYTCVEGECELIE
ncbi:MAG: DUF4382 domain-containing protein [Candidatus Woesearchaeota archaeon]|nr:MAG: DUF4382 domain-containing protein [Candidatus Woesearchaeota archaeon]